jgi:hypothetical protein
MVKTISLFDRMRESRPQTNRNFNPIDGSFQCHEFQVQNMNELSLFSTIVATEEALSCNIKGEVVILNLATGVYYGLNNVGAFIWELLNSPRTVEMITEAVLREFDVDRERCERDVLKLLSEMAGNKMVKVSNEVCA